MEKKRKFDNLVYLNAAVLFMARIFIAVGVMNVTQSWVATIIMFWWCIGNDLLLTHSSTERFYIGRTIK